MKKWTRESSGTEDKDVVVARREKRAEWRAEMKAALTGTPSRGEKNALSELLNPLEQAWTDAPSTTSSGPASSLDSSVGSLRSDDREFVEQIRVDLEANISEVKEELEGVHLVLVR